MYVYRNTLIYIHTQKYTTHKIYKIRANKFTPYTQIYIHAYVAHTHARRDINNHTHKYVNRVRGKGRGEKGRQGGEGITLRRLLHTTPLQSALVAHLCGELLDLGYDSWFDCKVQSKARHSRWKR